MNIAFLGSSLLSAYWNGAATYYRGIIRALHAQGHRVTFYEPDAYGRQQNRDMDPPDWAEVVVYEDSEAAALQQVKNAAASANLLIKASGVGVHDALLEAAVLSARREGTLAAFWDVDAPATLERLHNDPTDPFIPLIPQYDVILTYGGGDPVIKDYQGFGARLCVPIYNALDPATHHPENPEMAYLSDLSFLGNRLPDREARVEEFFLRAAQLYPEGRFLLGGNGWHDKPLPQNVKAIGHLGTGKHNAWNCSARAVLNISRAGMARYGFSPATRVFEAAGAGACMITDAWEGIAEFFEPGKEILVAHSGEEVADLVRNLSVRDSKLIGGAAYRRALACHTYEQRAIQFNQVLEGLARS